MWGWGACLGWGVGCAVSMEDYFGEGLLEGLLQCFRTCSADDDEEPFLREEERVGVGSGELRISVLQLLF